MNTNEDRLRAAITSAEGLGFVLANSNRVEEAWFVRGLLDSLAGLKAEPGDEYKHEYLTGYASLGAL